MSRSRKGPSRPRNKRHEADARQTQAAQQRAEEKRRTTLRAYRIRRAVGWTLVGLGILVGASHWLAHLLMVEWATHGVMALVAGYPMALLLGIAGAIVLSK